MASDEFAGKRCCFELKMAPRSRKRAVKRGQQKGQGTWGQLLSGLAKRYSKTV